APLVESGGRHEATPVFHGVPGCAFGLNPFGPNVDEKGELLGVPDERRDQPPTHQREMALALRHPHDRNRLGRGDVVSRRKFLILDIAEQLFQLFRVGPEEEASAHLWWSLVTRRG